MMDQCGTEGAFPATWGARKNQTLAIFFHHCGMDNQILMRTACNTPIQPPLKCRCRLCQWERFKGFVAIKREDNLGL